MLSLQLNQKKNNGSSWIVASDAKSEDIVEKKKINIL